MTQTKILRKRVRNLLGGAATVALLTGFASAGALAQEQKTQLDIPAQPLGSALKAFSVESDSQVLFNEDAVAGRSSPSLKGNYSRAEALALLLKGTDLHAEQSVDHVYLIKPVGQHSEVAPVPQTRLAQTASSARAAAGIESVVVTSSKIKGDIQTVPIAITALSQEQLTSRQIAGGPDLVKEVPNLTFTKTNFSGYSIQIRGIGTQAISVTTDPAVAVAFNDIPFIRNHFFEQEFYDVSQVEILRGPQGTLYGRNATAGVVNLISAKPTDQFEAMASADFGNYHNRRFEGMVNVPVVDDRLDIRVAAEWTKRDGYSFNEYTNDSIDGRNLWSSRVTIGLKPTQNLQMYLVWEHFQESDDRLRSSKQLCKTDHGPGAVIGDTTNGGGVTVDGTFIPFGGSAIAGGGQYYLQGCLPASLYSKESFEAPLSFALPYYIGLQAICCGYTSDVYPYPDIAQSPDLRTINSSLNPIYDAKNDVVELNADYALTPALTVTSQTGFGHDFLYSTEDYNRFGSNAGVFGANAGFNGGNITNAQGVFCDPQLGCSDRLIAQDLSQEHAWQLSQEFRLTSNFSGPLNFSAGANYLHYETQENYYVFSNAFTLIEAGNTIGVNYSSANPWIPGVSDNSQSLKNGFQFNDLTKPAELTSGYIDPNPLGHLNDNGHNYFLSKNPYVLNSYAAFGEADYRVTDELKLVGGLRWTDDEKHFLMIPSWVASSGWGYPVAATVDQKWNKLTGRAVANWTPKLDFTDQTLIYGSYAHGYKAGGANPPGAIFSATSSLTDDQVSHIQPVHPLTFRPEFVDAFELGSKNTLLDGALTLNGDIFYYDYKDYQISEIVDRTAINLNFSAKVNGAELETTWEPLPGLKLSFAGGYENTRINDGESAVDLMDRTAGHPGWFVVKPFVNEASNCIFPAYVAKEIGIPVEGLISFNGSVSSFCSYAYNLHLDPFTALPYTPNPTVQNFDGTPKPLTVPVNYLGYDPNSVDPTAPADVNDGYGLPPNNGAGFSKDLSGHSLPNAPHYTTSLSADYTLPVSEDWAATLHGDFYWQSQSWARVFNDRPYDKLRGYSNVNLALILTSAGGWQVMGYVKNIFDTTAITGDFLNSDDSGLTTNVFLTDPRLFGVRVTRNW